MVVYTANPFVGKFFNRNLALAVNEDFWVDNCGYGGYATKARQREMMGRKQNIIPRTK